MLRVSWASTTNELKLAASAQAQREQSPAGNRFAAQGRARLQERLAPALLERGAPRAARLGLGMQAAERWPLILPSPYPGLLVARVATVASSGSARVQLEQPTAEREWSPSLSGADFVRSSRALLVVATQGARESPMGPARSALDRAVDWHRRLAAAGRRAFPRRESRAQTAAERSRLGSALLRRIAAA